MTQDLDKYYYVIERCHSKSIIRGFLAKGVDRGILYSNNGNIIVDNLIDDAPLMKFNNNPKINGVCELIETIFKPGQHHARMVRPTFGVDWIENIVFVDEKCSSTFRGLGERGDKLARFKRFDPVNLDLQTRCLLLWSGFNEVAKTVYAAEENFNAYGPAIRSCLVLACMEVESIFKNCFIRNSSNIKDNYSTKDYVRLKDAFDLARLELKFLRFPGLRLVAPFQGWSNDRSSKSLIFYDAYNDTKHDSEGQLKRANFGMLVHAMAALAILFYVQTGRLFTDELQIITYPKFNLLDCYIDPELIFNPSLRQGEGWVEIPYFKKTF